MPASLTDDKGTPGAAVTEEIQIGVSGETPESNTPEGSQSTESPAVKEDDNKPKDVADAVRAALNPKEEQSSGSTEENPEETDPEDSEEGDKKPDEEEIGDLTEEELKTYNAKTAKRFKKLDADNKTFKAQVERDAPKVQQLDQIQAFVSKAGLSKDDVNTGFQIMNLMRNDPEKAFAELTPIYNQLRALVGEVVPDDLMGQVERGELAFDRAREISKLRAKDGLNTVRTKEVATQQENDSKASRAAADQKRIEDIGAAVSAWEQNWKKSDPDYSLKSVRVTEAIEAELSKQMLLKMQGKQHTLPQTTEEAVKMAKAVKEKVDKEMQSLTRNKTPLKPVLGNGITAGAKAKPATAFDAVAQAVGYH